MMKKLKWVIMVTAIAGFAGFAVGWYVVQRNNRISAEDTKYRSPIETESDRITRILEGDFEREIEIEEDLLSNMRKIRLSNVEYDDSISLEQSLMTIIKDLQNTDISPTIVSHIKKWKEELPHEIREKKIGKFHLKKATLAEIMDVLFIRCDLEWEIVNNKLKTEDFKPEGDPGILRKLDRIKLGSENFTKDTTFREAINYLRLRARELDDEEHPHRRGIRFFSTGSDLTIYAGDIWSAKVDDVFASHNKLEERIVGEISMNNLSLKEALTIICRRVGVKWDVNDYKVIISPR